MADDLTAAAPATTPTTAAPAPPKKQVTLDSEDPKLFRRRFGIVYGLLVAALAATGVGIALALGTHIGGESTGWSSWSPANGGIQGASEIADHVAPMYRLPSGTQLVDVIAKPPTITSGTQTVPLHYLVIQGTKGAHDQVTDVSPGNTIMFSMCGLGPSCSIATGTPSVARGRLVRREVLELSLFTFKYIGGIDNVIAFMPTVQGAQPSVVYLRRSDLNAALGQPLDKTLSPKTPLPDTIPAREVRTVDATTESRVFPFSVVQTQFGDVAMVLKPLSA